MKKYTKQSYIEEFIKQSHKCHCYTNSINAAKHNQAMRVFEKKLYPIVREDLSFAKEVYKELLASDDDQVLIVASSQCLALKIYEQESIKILKRLSNESQNIVLRVDAGMTLFRMEHP